MEICSQLSLMHHLGPKRGRPSLAASSSAPMSSDPAAELSAVCPRLWAGKALPAAKVQAGRLCPPVEGRASGEIQARDDRVWAQTGSWGAWSAAVLFSGGAGIAAASGFGEVSSRTGSGARDRPVFEVRLWRRPCPTDCP